MKKTLKNIITNIITWQAKIILSIKKPFIIAVVGSVGKTTTKEAVAFALRHTNSIRYGEKSYNSEIGVPLAILGLESGWNNIFIWTRNIISGFFAFFKKYPKYLIVEVGSDHPGDIDKIGKWLKPDILVVTSFGEVPVHIEHFENPKDLFDEDRSMVKHVKKGGIVIANADDAESIIASKMAKSSLLYGISSEDSDIKAVSISYQLNEKGFPIGISFKVSFEEKYLPITIKDVIGKQHVYPVLSAIAVSHLCNLNIIDSMNSLSELYVPPKGRMRIIAGKKERILIDDTYNSSPIAVKEALKAVNELSGEIKRHHGQVIKKCAVLGDMLELGRYSIAEHKKIGAMLHEEGFFLLVAIGEHAKNFKVGAIEAGFDPDNIFEFDNVAGFASMADNILPEWSLVLLKGSQGARIEKITKKLMADESISRNLLIRQDKYWAGR